MKRFEKPIRTEIYWSNCETFETISILGETEKALLAIITKRVKRGTSMITDLVEREQWIPKSIWDNDKNFEDINYKGGTMIVKVFKPPYFLNK